MTLAAPVPVQATRPAARVRRVALVRVQRGAGGVAPPAPVALLSLAAAARAHGYGDVHVLDLAARGLGPEEAALELARLAPDVVGLSALSSDARALHALARLLRERLPDVRIVAGGPHATEAPGDVLADPAIALVVRGEAEETFPLVLDGLAQGRQSWAGEAGVSWRGPRGTAVHEPERPPPDDLDALPLPAWDLLGADATGPRAALVTSRACATRCPFCHGSYGRTFRARSAASVLAEVDLLVRQRGARELVFLDDIFNFSTTRAKAIARGLIERGHDLRLTFVNGLRGDHLDAELVDLLVAAGLRECTLVVESAAPRVQRATKRNLRLDDVRAAAAHAAARGVAVHGAFVLGFPTETEEEMRATMAWAARSPFRTASFFRAVRFDGAGLFGRAFERGAWQPDDWATCTTHRGQTPPPAVAPARIDRLRRAAYARFYLRPGRLWQLARARLRAAQTTSIAVSTEPRTPPPKSSRYVMRAT